MLAKLIRTSFIWILIAHIIIRGELALRGLEPLNQEPVLPLSHYHIVWPIDVAVTIHAAYMIFHGMLEEVQSETKMNKVASSSQKPEVNDERHPSCVGLSLFVQQTLTWGDTTDQAVQTHITGRLSEILCWTINIFNSHDQPCCTRDTLCATWRGALLAPSQGLESFQQLIGLI